MKKKRKKEKKQKKRILNKIISNFLIVLIILLIILILIEFKIWKYFEKKEIVSFKINDECSVMMNNILHNIKDEAGCENSCGQMLYFE
jgi:ABC-type phosphate transport system permease subunit